MKPRSTTPGVTVIIPAHNEENGIGAVLSEIRHDFVLPSGRPPETVEILVVDDGSTDATASRAREAGAQVVVHHRNRGYGAAIKTGLRAALHDTIVLIDADGTYPASDIEPLLQLLKSSDMAVGARTGAEVHIPLERRPAKWVLVKTAEYLAEQKIPDLNSGLRVFYKDDALRYERLYPSGFSFTTTITLAYLNDGLDVEYLPINYRRRTGKSKLRPIRDTKNLFLTVFRSILFFNPLRVCLPISFAIAALGLFVLLFLRDPHGNIYDGTITVLAMCALQVFITGFLADVIARMR